MSAITLLDGGMGQELVHRAGDRPTPLWSTQVMVDHPGLVAEVHGDYADAGASVATTNSYAIHRDRLLGTPLEDQLAELLALALKEAQNSGSARIAGAIGPLVASYRPDLHPDPDTATPAYAEIAQALAPGCDLILAETVASVDHARSVLAGALSAGKPVWIAMTVDDQDGTRLRSGEHLAEAVAAVADHADAVLVNCSAPEAVPAALPILAASARPFGAYANGFEKIAEGFLTAKPTVDALTSRRDLTPAAYAELVLRWMDQGATIVGGCCEVGPKHIKEIHRRLLAADYTII